MNFFDEAALRLKQQLKVTEDKDVASLLGLNSSSWAKRKKRESFPKKELYALAAMRPELNLDLNYILGGERPPAPPPETHDEFITRQRAISHTRALIDAMPLSELARLRLGVLMTGDPLKDGPMIAGALMANDPPINTPPMGQQMNSVSINAPFNGSVAGRDIIHQTRKKSE